ncbi:MULTISPECIES: aroma-sacti cluster domain-containing protein [Nonomuraea]|jgi:hypothetical protein|uniref:aroma-sacti cluster domain-containing protein n=1 Tax=Nonomuraea TaxID=83681 RepID=UPI001CD98736|nr:aroma-sacti cluster domain-containing protein [Nonomuraea aurantiaca]MCA2219771.1 hypothetical protein [Nonomuraea aurantiaca]
MNATGSGGFDALATLRAGGHPIDLLDERQRTVFASLTETEVAVLNSIKKRLDDHTGEVEGQELKLV